MNEHFWTGFEKQAATTLSKQSALKGVLPKELFEKAVNLKHQNAVRRLVEKGHKMIEGKPFIPQTKEILQKAWGAIKGARKPGARERVHDMTQSMVAAGPGAHLPMINLTTWNPHAFQRVSGGLKGRLSKTPPTLGAQIGGHEMSEIAHSRSSKMFTPSMPSKFPGMQKYVTEKMLKLMPPHMTEAVKELPATAQALKGRTLTGQHRSPGVLVDESNKLFHEADADAKAVMTHARKGTGEHDIMRRSGLRYGEEYVQPGTKRHKKLLKNMYKKTE